MEHLDFAIGEFRDMKMQPSLERTPAAQADGRSGSIVEHYSLHLPIRDEDAIGGQVAAAQA